MNKLFYSRLAVSNIRKNGRTYIPYILTCVGTIMMFYMMHAISVNKGIGDSSSVAAMLQMGTWVIGIFSAIFLFYTNSFLIKRRKKELGLYNILGMEKKHLALVLLLENFYIFLLSLAGGLAAGAVLCKLMFLLLLRLLRFPVSFEYAVSWPSVRVTVVLFAAIFLATLLANLFQIHLAKPVELLKGGQTGEKEPKTKWLLTLFGVLTLGTGYTIAIVVKSPLSALMLFFVAVVLVMIGTYSLFTAGSIALLKMLRRNRRFYYRTKNFTAVSGMIYRMKQNAAGLASICILSTAVLLMISTSVALYAGMEDSLSVAYPRGLVAAAKADTQEQADAVRALLEAQAKKDGVTPENLFSYRYAEFGCKKDGDAFASSDGSYYTPGYCSLMFLTLQDYNALNGSQTELSPGEALVYCSVGSYEGDTVSAGGKTFAVKEKLKDIKIGLKRVSYSTATYIVVVDGFDAIDAVRAGMTGSKNDARIVTVEFDLAGTDEEIIAFAGRLNAAYDANEIKGASWKVVENKAEDRKNFLQVYGGLFFLGIFLGLLFLMATVLIIYYKQISEGYDDKERFEILQKVGMSKAEIRETVRRQILIVFFLPLLTAVIHILFAFPMIEKLLTLLVLSNIKLFLLSTLVTVLLFGLIYGLVYSLTARAYYRIVE